MKLWDKCLIDWFSGVEKHQEEFKKMMGLILYGESIKIKEVFYINGNYDSTIINLIDCLLYPGEFFQFDLRDLRKKSILPNFRGARVAFVDNFCGQKGQGPYILNKFISLNKDEFIKDEYGKFRLHCKFIIGEQGCPYTSLKNIRELLTKGCLKEIKLTKDRVANTNMNLITELLKEKQYIRNYSLEGLNKYVSEGFIDVDS